MAPKTAPARVVTTEEEAINVLIKQKIIAGREDGHSMGTLIETMSTWSKNTLLEGGKNSIITTQAVVAVMQAVMTLLGKYKDSYTALHNQITISIREVKEELKELMKEEIGRIEVQTGKAMNVAKDTAKEVHKTLTNNTNIVSTDRHSYTLAADPK